MMMLVAERRTRATTLLRRINMTRVSVGKIQIKRRCQKFKHLTERCLITNQIENISCLKTSF